MGLILDSLYLHLIDVIVFILDMPKIVRAKIDFDVVGYYSHPIIPSSTFKEHS